jgi:hypothetical protein
MVKNSSDVGMDVNKLRALPIADGAQVMTTCGSMTKDEIELVWPVPSMSAAGLL